MSEGVFFKVVVPLMEVVYTALICISTPLSEDNFYSVMTDLKKEDGTPLFTVVQITLACEICTARRRNKKDDRPCGHTKDRIPKWKSGESHETVRQLYGARTADFDRESRGIIRSDGSFIFKRSWFTSWNQRPLQSLVPDYIIMTCDPDGGGLGVQAADLGVVSAYFYEGKMVVCGVASQKGTPRETSQLVASHVDALRRIKRFANCWIFFIPESNLQHACYNYAAAVANKARVYSIVDDRHMASMTRTGSGTKLMYSQDTAQFLCKKDRLFWDADFVVGNPFEPETPELVKKQQTKLQEQLGKLRQIASQTKSVISAIKYTVSGKTDDKGVPISGQNDDLAITFLMQATMDRNLTEGMFKLPLHITREVFPHLLEAKQM